MHTCNSILDRGALVDGQERKKQRVEREFSIKTDSLRHVTDTENANDLFPSASTSNLVETKKKDQVDSSDEDNTKNDKSEKSLENGDSVDENNKSKKGKELFL